MNNRTINGWRFTWVEEHNWYQCRGDVMYDDYHDQIPEPSLWKAALALAEILTKEGHKAEANHSEKGWVEVTIN